MKFEHFFVHNLYQREIREALCIGLWVKHKCWTNVRILLLLLPVFSCRKNILNLITRLFIRIYLFCFLLCINIDNFLWTILLTTYGVSYSKMKSVSHFLFQFSQFYFTLSISHLAKIKYSLKPVSLYTTSPLVNYVNAHHFRN